MKQADGSWVYMMAKWAHVMTPGWATFFLFEPFTCHCGSVARGEIVFGIPWSVPACRVVCTSSERHACAHVSPHVVRDAWEDYVSRRKSQT